MNPESQSWHERHQQKLREIEELQAQFRAALASMATSGVLASIRETRKATAETRKDVAAHLEQCRRFDARMAQLFGYPHTRSTPEPDLERRVTELERRVERLERAKDDEPS